MKKNCKKNGEEINEKSGKWKENHRNVKKLNVGKIMENERKL